MTSLDFNTETPENWDQKCCCALILDVSTSMKGEPIKELNEGLREFYRDIKADATTSNRLEVAIVEFSTEAKTLVTPNLVNNFEMPTLTTKGSTKMVDGVRRGMEIIRARKSWYKATGQPYYRPWIILISDGEPDKDQDIAALASEIKAGMDNRDFYFFALGVQKADMNMLKTISDPSMPASQLKGLKFSEFFKWLSASMTSVTNSEGGGKVNLPNPSEWMVGISV